MIVRIFDGSNKVLPTVFGDEFAPDAAPPDKFVDNTVRVFKLAPDGTKGEFIRTDPPFPEGYVGTYIHNIKNKEDEGMPAKIQAPEKADLKKDFERLSCKIDQLAKEYGVSWSVVRRWLQEAELIEKPVVKAEQSHNDHIAETPTAVCPVKPQEVRLEKSCHIEGHEVFDKSLADLTIADVCMAETIMSETESPHPRAIPPVTGITVNGIEPENFKEAMNAAFLKKDDLQAAFERLTLDDEFTALNDEPIPFFPNHNYIPEHHIIAEEIVCLLDLKQQDYGVDNIKKFGSAGCLVRASDKIERLINLTWLQKSIANFESVEDTWMDIIGHGILGLMEVRSRR
jgi:hypothetical protein